MSVEAKLALTEVWTQWEGHVVNGVFPLRRLLSASSHSAVFLTEHAVHKLPNAALKLVPVVPPLAQAQLSRWATAAALSHPHLIRLLDAGRCELGGLEFLFAVMEYAEQTLSQILPHRALTPDEAREMLVPTLSSLGFLHQKNLVHGRLKPSHFLVVDDQLKLSSDTIHPVGESTTMIAEYSIYDAPEAKDGDFSAAGDLWGLGVTLVEALTQQLPSWPDGNSKTASLPAALPSAFAEIIGRCLDRNPAGRPRIADVEAWINPAPQSPAVSPPPPPVPAPDPRASKPRAPVVESPVRAPEKLLTRRYLFPAVGVLFVAGAAVWAGLYALGSRSSVDRAAAPTAAAQYAETSASAATGISAPAASANSVLHEEIPDVPQRALNTIRGHINVAVRVTVNGSGDVLDATLEKRGASQYFARLATEAARKWKFAPTDARDSRKWLLRFEFSRGGVTGNAGRPRGSA